MEDFKRAQEEYELRQEEKWEELEEVNIDELYEYYDMEEIDE
jgi:hypothetical protein